MTAKIFIKKLQKSLAINAPVSGNQSEANAQQQTSNIHFVLHI